ncbi:hypothetical protein [Aquimarina longa]|uniref:hypothetical protein n=1 Tax=Aquimarina longa TaxID=1080221 RepID=UPI000AB765CF|nr:hypothetical protein [Aquimarina longa]
MAQSKDFDYTTLTVGAVALLIGASIGVFMIAPWKEKVKQKQLGTKKTDTQKPKG